jgi:Tol biopolymer transport system component
MNVGWKVSCLIVSTLMISEAGFLTAKESQADEARFLTHIRQLIYEGKRSGEGYFSPDGKNLIFQSERLDDNPFFQIYILDLESGDSHLVSTGRGKTTCSFFRPGSNEVLFASSHLDLQVRQRQKDEIEFRASGQERRYSWDYDVHMDIFSADRTGSNLTRLTDSHGYDAEDAYSPDGNKITNIYDYTYAIEALKIGEEAEIVVLRDGKELTLTIVPATRE